MSWTDDQPPGLLAAADQELAGLRGWIRELAAEHPHVKEHVGAMEALFTLAKHIENAVDARPGMPNAWLIAAAAVDTLTATQADADKWEKRYAEMLAQRDTALQAAGQTQGVVAAARAAVANILELHPQIREARPAWFHDSTLRLVAAVDGLADPCCPRHELLCRIAQTQGVDSCCGHCPTWETDSPGCCGEHQTGCKAPAYPCCDDCPDAEG